MPTTTSGIVHGTSAISLSAVWPGRAWLSASARPRPRTRCPARLQATKAKVLRKVWARTGSTRARR
ncbi:MAG TPA: hypothetical protein DDZ42_20315 [Candidatus Rokubacteria bacterium]|nr:MAG: hypothetical protein A2050_10030 [Candidatus Rokubacteria bacterium GWA2_73_35]HBH04223.1 hypothetical protein [Candidatus Rokubacteria bacterium]